jgi:hypothetical protein
MDFGLRPISLFRFSGVGQYSSLSYFNHVDCSEKFPTRIGTILHRIGSEKIKKRHFLPSDFLRNISCLNRRLVIELRNIFLEQAINRTRKSKSGNKIYFGRIYSIMNKAPP